MANIKNISALTCCHAVILMFFMREIYPRNMWEQFCANFELFRRNFKVGGKLYVFK